jgi:hypothetical protein
MAKGRDPATLSGPICLSGELANPKKKKKMDSPVATIHPNGQGERDLATPSGHLAHFCLSGEPKKNSNPPKKSFLMPQKSILMPQIRF